MPFLTRFNSETTDNLKNRIKQFWSEPVYFEKQSFVLNTYLIHDHKYNITKHIWELRQVRTQMGTIKDNGKCDKSPHSTEGE